MKLSALHPRYEFAQRERVLGELTPRLLALAEHARDAGIGLTVDAEESERLDLSLDLFEAVYRAPSLAGYAGFGLAVQAYQKRAIAVIDWLAHWRSRRAGAFRCGWSRAPTGTRRSSATRSAGSRAIRCSRARPPPTSPTSPARAGCWRPATSIYPMFATHNAHTLATILELAGTRRDFEFQRLHGMGEALYAQVVGDEHLGVACRVYAPVGSHEDLLPYLVRRLLENGANTSFVNRIVDARVPVEVIVADPVAEVEALDSRPHPRIPLPRDLFGTRRNSRGVNLADPAALAATGAADAGGRRPWSAAPLVGGRELPGKETVDLQPGRPPTGGRHGARSRRGCGRRCRAARRRRPAGLGPHAGRRAREHPRARRRSVRGASRPS